LCGKLSLINSYRLPSSQVNDCEASTGSRALPGSRYAYRRLRDAHSSYTRSRTVVSKDAYMLVYTRKQDTKPVKMEPSSRAREIISGMNVVHEKAVAQYNER
jgi:hypothetical protein